MFQAAGEEAPFVILAKDAHGSQKSLGGDRFAVSWCHTASGDCTTGEHCQLPDLYTP